MGGKRGYLSFLFDYYYEGLRRRRALQYPSFTHTHSLHKASSRTVPSEATTLHLQVNQTRPAVSHLVSFKTQRSRMKRNDLPRQAPDRRAIKRSRHSGGGFSVVVVRTSLLRNESSGCHPVAFAYSGDIQYSSHERTNKTTATESATESATDAVQ
jgi:hypothetical protein